MKTHRTVMIGFALLAAAVVVPAWRAQPLRASQPAQGGVRTAPAGVRLGGKPGQKGETYYSFEAQGTRHTTRYVDAIAVAERSVEGDFVTRLSDLQGNEIAQFRVDRIDGVNDVVQYSPRAGKPLRAFTDAVVRPTLDWSNHQAYSLWKDGVISDNVALEWKNQVIRRRGAHSRDEGKEFVELQTDSMGGFSTKTSRRAVRDPDLQPGRRLRGEVFVTQLAKNGAEVGVLKWVPESQTLIWSMPGLTEGFIAADHLKEYGGFPFVPDPAWLNVQALAFHHFKSQMQKTGFVAQQQPRRWSERALGFFMPTVLANEPGCDGLHWLDGTVFRFCCDIHDRCYEASGCNWKSWWQFWNSWTCDICNSFAISCFMGGGGGGAGRGA
ncbi:MAG TPA: hypothetical protein VKE96_05315 [Vicinamibacterales bacterium]|nr:hypothetical protein [Vicinamibacterales bacterium]